MPRARHDSCIRIHLSTTCIFYFIFAVCLPTIILFTSDIEYVCWYACTMCCGSMFWTHRSRIQSVFKSRLKMNVEKNHHHPTHTSRNCQTWCVVSFVKIIINHYNVENMLTSPSIAVYYRLAWIGYNVRVGTFFSVHFLSVLFEKNTNHDYIVNLSHGINGMQFVWYKSTMLTILIAFQYFSWFYCFVLLFSFFPLSYI